MSVANVSGIVVDVHSAEHLMDGCVLHLIHVYMYIIVYIHLLFKINTLEKESNTFQNSGWHKWWLRPKWKGLHGITSYRLAPKLRWKNEFNVCWFLSVLRAVASKLTCRNTHPTDQSVQETFALGNKLRKFIVKNPLKLKLGSLWWTNIAIENHHF